MLTTMISSFLANKINMRAIWSITFLLFFIQVPKSFCTAQISGTVYTDAGKVKYQSNTVVYIDYIDRDFPPSENALINQEGLKFIPKVLPIVKGTTVDFRNSDDVLHNVFTPDSCAKKFNLGTWPKNEIRSYTYETVGCESVILCNVHPEMEAYVIVLQNPYFTEIDEAGHFIINNVPPGNYTLKVWNERLSADDIELIVTSTGKENVQIHLR